MYQSLLRRFLISPSGAPPIRDATALAVAGCSWSRIVSTMARMAMSAWSGLAEALLSMDTSRLHPCAARPAVHRPPIRQFSQSFTLLTAHDASMDHHA